MAIDWLARRAELSPRRIALIDGATGVAIDYRAFDRRAARAAAGLAERGVERGDRVAVLADTSVEYLDLLFACNKLGAVLVNLSWRLAPRELAAQLEHAAPRVLLSDASHAALADEVGGGRPRAAVGELGARAVPPPAPSLADDDPWVICYTGGSTATPRGVVQTHRMVTWNAINTVASWGLRADDVALLNAPLFHTGGLHVFTTPMVHVGGASLVVPRFEPDLVFDHLPRVSLLFGVPTMFQRLQAHRRWASADVGHLRLVISGGAPCPAPVFDAWFDKGVAFRTGYGLTEAGPNNFHLPAELCRAKRGSIGWPLMHVEARLIGGDGREVDGEEVGELCLRGPHVMAGYLGDPAASAAAIDGDGWLHTGDLARRDRDGAAYVVGRKKEMYISGGENVYPAEVERTLAEHPAVAEVAVVGVPDDRWGEAGVAFVALHPGRPADAAELSTFLVGRLASLKRPSRYVFGDLPKTAVGKIDKPALLRSIT